MIRQHFVDIASDALSFSSGHFTIFDAEHRENLHGHDYKLNANLRTHIGETGISFDYRDVKNKLKALTETLNTRTLLPANNPFLSVTHDTDHVCARFSHETLTFLARDVVILPVRNTTLEELSQWFLSQFITRHRDDCERWHIDVITLGLSTRPGQTGTSVWRKADATQT